MAVYKEEKTGTWRAVYRYTDWNGERKQTQKRGFKTKREAQAWEREQVHKTPPRWNWNRIIATPRQRSVTPCGIAVISHDEEKST